MLLPAFAMLSQCMQKGRNRQFKITWKAFQTHLIIVGQIFWHQNGGGREVVGGMEGEEQLIEQNKRV